MDGTTGIRSILCETSRTSQSGRTTFMMLMACQCFRICFWFDDRLFLFNWMWDSRPGTLDQWWWMGMTSLECPPPVSLFPCPPCTVWIGQWSVEYCNVKYLMWSLFFLHELPVLEAPFWFFFGWPGFFVVLCCYVNIETRACKLISLGPQLLQDVQLAILVFVVSSLEIWQQHKLDIYNI